MAGGAAVQWIGHATAVVEIGGERVLIDPLGRRRCRRIEGYSTVLVTHSHVDHLNRWTLKALEKSAHLVVPQGAADIVRDLGFAKVSEVEPGDQLAIGRSDLICVPTKHDAGRWRKGDRPINTGYVLAHGGVHIHHAGDIDMSSYDVFEDIGKKLGITATMLPIGGMLPVWYYRLRRRALDRGVHIDPDTALHIAQRLGARTMIPVHWGTVHLRLGPPSMPAKRLAKMASKLGLSNLVRVLGHGQATRIGGELPAGEVLDEAAHAVEAK